MTDKPPEKDKDATFQRTLERMLGTPPKPHKQPQKSKPTGKGGTR